MKHELQNIISGKSQVKFGDTIQTITSYIARGKKTGVELTDKKQVKSEETEIIKTFCEEKKIWIEHINPDLFISSGAEQRVYLQNEFKVIKLNDAIYFETWTDYLHNLLLNNFFFPDTAYNLIGFYLEGKNLFAVVEQAYIKSDSLTDLNNVYQFLIQNGFKNKKNHDYFHPDLGIILEDLHDENVLTFQGNLFFIDTVFYIKDNFYD